MDFSHISTKSNVARCRGATIVELLIGLMLAVIAFFAVVSFTLFASRSLANMFNHTEMQYASRKALDYLSRDIRQCQSLQDFTPAKLTLLDYDGQLLVYEYSAQDKSLARVKGGSRMVLLTGCETLDFSIYQRPATSGTFDRAKSTQPASAKVIDVSWNCVRTILGVPTATDIMRGARIVIRK